MCCRSVDSLDGCLAGVHVFYRPGWGRYWGGGADIMTRFRVISISAATAAVYIL